MRPVCFPMQLKKHTKVRYKHAVRRLKKNRICRKMVEALVDDSSRDFWREVLQCKTNKQTSAPCVDGVQVLQTYGLLS